MPSLRVGVVVRWVEVERLLRAMLAELRHRPALPKADDHVAPEVVVRDARCQSPGGWVGRPEVVLLAATAGVVLEKAGVVRLCKPFTLTQLAEAIRRAVESSA